MIRLKLGLRLSVFFTKMDPRFSQSFGDLRSMRSIYNYFQAFAFASAALFLVPHSAMARNMIDFSTTTNLKAVYDAGLRPWRVRSDEISSLTISDQKLSILLPGIAPFDVDAEIGTFGVLAGNELSKADFVSQPMALLEAGEEVKKICSAIGIETDGLNKSVNTFLAMGMNSPAPQHWNGWGEKNGIRIQITLRPMFGLTEVLANVNVGLSFYKPGKPMKFLEEPIKPPPGYENVSMEPPPISSQGTPFPPTKFASDQIPRHSDSVTTATPIQAAKKSALPGLPVLLVEVLIAVIAGLVIFFLRRKP